MYSQITEMLVSFDVVLPKNAVVHTLRHLVSPSRLGYPATVVVEFVTPTVESSPTANHSLTLLPVMVNDQQLGKLAT